jgi:hypothetical protein
MEAAFFLMTVTCPPQILKFDQPGIALRHFNKRSVANTTFSGTAVEIVTSSFLYRPQFLRSPFRREKKRERVSLTTVSPSFTFGWKLYSLAIESHQLAAAILRLRPTDRICTAHGKLLSSLEEYKCTYEGQLFIIATN